MRQTTIHSHCFKSPVGNLYLRAEGKHLIALDFKKRNPPAAASSTTVRFVEKENRVIHQAIRQLREYFSGSRKRFNVPIRLTGTAFQKKAWGALRQVPYGETISYQVQASAIGSLKAFRAVGSANGKNPIAIIVPCHRVIASNGKLSGYAGGSKIKARLLRLEKNAG